MVMIEFPFDLSILPKHEGAYIVGGAVRDLLLKRPPADYDIAVSEDADTYARLLGANIGGHVVRIGKPGLDVIRVVSDLGIFDISPIQGASIEEDLGKRDFTINAMAFAISSMNIIDIFEGIPDLAEKRIRMVSGKIFQQDPVRLIRAFRMGADVGFDIESETEATIEKEAINIRDTAAERVREEFLKMLQSVDSHAYLTRMADTGLLLEIFPEMKVLKGFGQNRHHAHDVFEHTMKAYGYLEDIINTPEPLLPEAAASIKDSVRGKRAALLKCAMLFHDIGKPSVHSTDEEGAVHFHGHDHRSAEIAENIGSRLRFSNKERRYLESVIRSHNQPLFLFLAEENRTLTRKGVTRFFIKSGEYTPDILLHSIADGRGKGSAIHDAAFVQFIDTLFGKYYRSFIPRTSAPALLTGHDLIESFGISPSPIFKVILNTVEEARLSGKIRSKKAAHILAKSIIDCKTDDPIV